MASDAEKVNGVPVEDDSGKISYGAVFVLALLGACILLLMCRQIGRLFNKMALGAQRNQQGPRLTKRPPRDSRQKPAPAPAEPPPQAKGPGISLRHLKKQAQASMKSRGPGADEHDKGSQHPLYLGCFKGHKDVINGIAFSRDGTHLASACEGQSVRLFAMADLSGKGNAVRTRNFNLVPGGIAFGQSSDQLLTYLRSYVDGAVLTSLVPNQHKAGPAASYDVDWELPKLHGGREHAKRILSAQGIAVILSDSSQMRLVSLTGQPLTIIETAGLTNHGAALSQDGSFLAAATFAADIKVLFTSLLNSSETDCVWTEMWMASLLRHEVHEVRYNKQGGFESVAKVMDLKGHKRQVMCVAFSPDSKRAAVASQDGTWSVWNIAVRFREQEDPKRLLQEPQQVPSGQCYHHLAYGARSVLAGAFGTSLHFLNADTGELLESLPDAHDAAITALEWAPQRIDDKLPWCLASAGSDKRLRIWRMPEP